MSPPDSGAADLVRLERFSPEPSQTRPAKFPIIALKDIEVGNEPQFLIDGLLASTGLAVVFGAPKSGKSFLIADAMFHIATGRRWAGRGVQQGAVVYISNEGLSGLNRRFIAMRRHYGVEGQNIPFGFISVMPNLGQASGDAEALIESIRDWAARFAVPPRAIVIDTLARAIGGGDENTAKDMSILVDNAGKITEAFDCLVVIVHHAGKTAIAAHAGRTRSRAPPTRCGPSRKTKARTRRRSTP